MPRKSVYVACDDRAGTPVPAERCLMYRVGRQHQHSAHAPQRYTQIRTMNGKTIEWGHNSLPLGTNANRARRGLKV